jgi:hypothetical protein
MLIETKGRVTAGAAMAHGVGRSEGRLLGRLAHGERRRHVRIGERHDHRSA